MGLGNLGFGELMVILVIVLVLFGARRVPEIGASIGKGIREFKKNISDMDREVREPIREAMNTDRLAAGQQPVRTPAVDEVRPEPKRLM
jgi:sec-independent protein translocase protein TatA